MTSEKSRKHFRKNIEIIKNDQMEILKNKVA